MSDPAATTELRRAQFLAVGGAATLVPLNSTMIAVALTHIADDFDLSVGSTSILVTLYLLAMLLGQPIAGRIADRIGLDRAIRLSLLAFLVASLAGAVAPTFVLLLAARVGQAAAGALLSPSVQALLRSAAAPEQRGQLFGTLHAMLGAGAASGPIVAGGLIELFGWRAVFVCNVPIVLAALAVRLPRSERIVKTPGEPREAIRNPIFVRAFAVQALSTLGQYALLLVAPVILEARGWSSGRIGLGLSSLTLGMIVFGPLGGRAGDRFGRRGVVVGGLAGAVAGLVLLVAAGDDVEALVLLVALGLFGIGLGFAAPSNVTAGIESVGERRAGAAAGILSVSRYVGSITSSLLIGVWLSDTGEGATRMFVVSALGGVAALVLALGLPRRAPEPELHAAMTTEDTDTTA